MSAGSQEASRAVLSTRLKASPPLRVSSATWTPRPLREEERTCQSLCVGEDEGLLFPLDAGRDELLQNRQLVFLGIEKPVEVVARPNLGRPSAGEPFYTHGKVTMSKYGPAGAKARRPAGGGSGSQDESLAAAPAVHVHGLVERPRPMD